MIGRQLLSAIAIFLILNRTVTTMMLPNELGSILTNLARRAIEYF